MMRNTTVARAKSTPPMLHTIDDPSTHVSIVFALIGHADEVYEHCHGSLGLSTHKKLLRATEMLHCLAHENKHHL